MRGYDIIREPHQLASCPNRPNCVSSLAMDENHSIEPFTCKPGPEAGLIQLRSILLSMKGIVVITCQQNYLYAECKSRIFGFIDDLEFHRDEKSGVVHVRSASRSGYYDFGVNRRRVEKIRQLLEQ